VLCATAKALTPGSHRAVAAYRVGRDDPRLASRRKTGLIALACCLIMSAPAGLRAQTLTQALADAYNTNPQLLAQRALLRATDEQVPQALANWRPTVNFTGQVGIATTSEQLPPGPTSVNPTTGEVTRSTTDRRHVQTRPDALTGTATK
jgi:hypothetical protein